MTEAHDVAVRRRDAALRRWGLRSWYLLGIMAAAMAVYAGLAAISGLVVPLIVATVVAMLFAPVTDLVGRYLPRSVAAGVRVDSRQDRFFRTVQNDDRPQVDQRPDPVGLADVAGQAV